jgi:hypothetical protein
MHKQELVILIRQKICLRRGTIMKHQSYLKNIWPQKKIQDPVPRLLPVPDRVVTRFPERGVRLVGTDGWSWDAPFSHTRRKVAETGDAGLIACCSASFAFRSASASSRASLRCFSWPMAIGAVDCGVAVAAA